MPTYFDFKCNDCGTKIGQLTIVAPDNNKAKKDSEEKTKCPKCNSTNCTYNTKIGK